MCIFCVHIRLFKRLCEMYAALCAIGFLCIQIRLLRVKQILRTCTAYALEAAYAYEYIFCT